MQIGWHLLYLLCFLLILLSYSVANFIILFLRNFDSLGRVLCYHVPIVTLQWAVVLDISQPYRWMPHIQIWFSPEWFWYIAVNNKVMRSIIGCSGLLVYGSERAIKRCRNSFFYPSQKFTSLKLLKYTACLHKIVK